MDPVQAFVAVFRQCSDPVQSTKNIGQYFAYFQAQPLGRRIARETARRRKGLADWGTLRSPQGAETRIPNDRRDPFFRLLKGSDEKLGKRLERWRAGKGPYPPAGDLPLGDLRGDTWYAPETDGLPEDHERWLSEAIGARLIKNRRGREIVEQDRLSCEYSYEYYLRPWRDIPKRLADIVLVSKEHVRPTLLLVEVKKQATLSPAKNPVPQVLGYREALLRENPGWRVRMLIAAVEYSTPIVLQQARSRRIEALRYNANLDRLTRA